MSSPVPSFDFAYARLAFRHGAEQERAIARLVRAVRPGGWVLIEDTDFAWIRAQPFHPRARAAACFQVARAIVAQMAQQDNDVHWGRHIAGSLRNAGLEHIGGEATMLLGHRALNETTSLTIDRFGTQRASASQLDASALHACFEALTAPDSAYTGSPAYAAWGSVPG